MWMNINFVNFAPFRQPYWPADSNASLGGPVDQLLQIIYYYYYYYWIY